MADEFASFADTVDTPAREMFLITPHDTNEVSPIPKAIRCNVAGNVTLRAMESGSDVTFAMVAGEVLPVRARFIRASTTATLHGLA